MRDLSGDPKLYYFPGSSRRKAILIFDPGYDGVEGGPRDEIQIYEHVSTLPRGEFPEELRRLGQAIYWKFAEQGNRQQGAVEQ